MLKKFLCIVVVILLSSSHLTGCLANKDIKEDSSEKSILENEITNPYLDMPIAYREVLKSLENYDFQNHSIPFISQKYALEDLSQDIIPELIVAQVTENGIFHTKVFSYEPTKKNVIVSDEVINVGVAQVGGFRGSMMLSHQGNGLDVIHWHSASGKGEKIHYEMISGKLTELRREPFMIEDDSIQKETYQDLTWYSINNDSPLKNLETDIYKKEIPYNKVIGEKNLGNRKEQNGTSMIEAKKKAQEVRLELLKSEGKQIFTGTLYINLTDEEVCALGNYTLPNAKSSERYSLLYLDTVADVAGQGDAPPRDCVKSVRIISLPWLDPKWNAFDKKKITIAFTKENARFPTDTSLPLMAPRVLELEVFDLADSSSIN